MKAIKYLLIITQREYAEQFVDALKGVGVQSLLIKLCQGTATDTVLNYLDLEKTEKVMIEAIVTSEKEKLVKDCLKNELNIYGNGNGIAVFVRVDGLGGNYAKEYFLGQDEVKKENTMVEQSKAVLILTVCDKGNSEMVMEAARGAGATGGTVVRAQGTGAEIAKFFGVTISKEKEMIYIVASREIRDGIMYAIMEKAGKETPAHGVVFSLPLDSVLGITALEN